MNLQFTPALLFAALATIAISSPALPQSKAPPPKAAQGKEQGKEPAKEQGKEQASPLTYSSWTKFCVKSDGQNTKQVCVTAADARLESGPALATAVVMEPQGGSKKVLRVTLPLGMQIAPGTRLVIDQGKPMPGSYVICFSNGCVADYDATADLISRLKKGRQLAVQAINADGQALSLNLPLGSFAKAYDGPPADMTGYEEQQEKVRKELQAFLAEVRKRAGTRGIGTR
jgi:invasion protein IalB